jgi:glycosyltransferase involved in cell wall biosynthesis
VNLSVVMAVRNAELYVAAAIESVLAQSVPDFEFLIVDDASTDTTSAILGAYARRDRRIRILANTSQLGPYPSANRALLEARGEVIARHDGDDWSPPDRFAIQLEALHAYPRVTLVTGAIEWFSDDPESTSQILRPPAWQRWLEWELLFSNAVGAGGHVMFPRVVAGEAVRFRVTQRYAADYELWCRLAEAGTVVCPSAVVYGYRRHRDSVTSLSFDAQQRCALHFRREYLGRFIPMPSAASVLQLAAFWRGEGSPQRIDFAAVDRTLSSLRLVFIDRIAARESDAAAERFDRLLDQELQARRREWLLRSARRGYGTGCRHIMTAARAQGELLSTIARVASDAARNIVRKAIKPAATH